MSSTPKPKTAKASKPTASAKAKSPKGKATKPAPDGKEAKPLSGLDAAAQVLRDAKEPLSAQDLLTRILERGIWTTKGKTPAATLYSGMIREISAKGSASRFTKADRGRFSAAS